VVLKVAVYGPDVAVPIVVHVEPPAGARWNSTLETPEPVSAAVAVSVTVPRRFAPGSPCVPVGAVVSIFATARLVYVVALPTLSATE
jgi:hypothetical protein